MRRETRRTPKRPHAGDQSPQLPTGNVARLVVALLRADPRRLWSAKQIARQLRLAEGTVRKEIWRLSREPRDGRPPVLVRFDHGLYRAFIDAPELANVEIPPPAFHAFQASCTLPQNRGWGVPGSAPRSWGSLGGKPAWTYNTHNRQWFRDTEWEGRLVTIAVTPSTGTVQVSLRASKEPVPVQRFEELDVWIRATCQAYGIFWSDRDVQVDVNNLELNWDYKQLYLSGLDRCSLKKFRNSLVQIYQKSQALRVELRVNGVQDQRLTLREVSSILTTLTTRTTPAPEPEYVPSPDELGPEVA